MLMSSVRAEILMRTIDPSIRNSLSSDQEAAIRAAVEQDAWANQPVDIRLSVPTPLGRLFLVLIGGRERRHPARLALDRIDYPLIGLGNLIAIACLAGLVGLAIYGLFCALGRI